MQSLAAGFCFVLFFKFRVTSCLEVTPKALRSKLKTFYFPGSFFMQLTRLYACYWPPIKLVQNLTCLPMPVDTHHTCYEQRLRNLSSTKIPGENESVRSGNC